MRRVLVAMTAALALSLVFGGTAEAKCSVTCLNRKVRQLSSGLIKAEKTIAALSKTVAQQGQQISAQNQTIATQGATIGGLSQKAKFVTFLEECLREVPISEYGEPEEEIGYLFDIGPEVIPTTALDVPFPGEFVGAWFLIDFCNPFETASVKAAKGLAPAADLRTLLRPQRRLR